MRDHELDEIIKSVFQAVFKVRVEAVTDEIRRGDLERWDSLGHLDLVESLREKFSIDITPEQALDMETVADIKRIVRALMDGDYDGGDSGKCGP